MARGFSAGESGKRFASRSNDEARTRAYEMEGMTRGDAQSAVEAENGTIEKEKKKMLALGTRIENELGGESMTRQIAKAIDDGDLEAAMGHLNDLKGDFQAYWDEHSGQGVNTDEKNLWMRTIDHAIKAVFIMEKAQVAAEYSENEGYNMHSENIVLMAKTVGDEDDLKNAQSILDLHMKRGELTPDLSRERTKLYDKLEGRFNDFLNGKPDFSKTGGYEPRY